MVECNLAKVDVAGSSPVSRSWALIQGLFFGLFFLICPKEAMHDDSLFDKQSDWSPR